ncbi:hypothetical protein PIB30_087027 [Stylosanthes scabra]|uniref:Uncharacterized protein n=1 Tax=Stylosanthes scabra TaxID=79078 RepID=A0ABU6VT40_9FABA|nr:hypothetical protein [Stylosanthes scabra]
MATLTCGIVPTVLFEEAMVDTIHPEPELEDTDPSMNVAPQTAGPSEVAALQRNQIESNSRIGSVKSTVKNIERMLKENLKLKSSASSHNEAPFTELWFDSNHRPWPKGVKAELSAFDGEGVEEWVF